MTSAQRILEAQACGRSGCSCTASVNKGRGSTHCPAHDDEVPSLSVTPSNSADLPLIHCHAGCTQEEVVVALRERGLWPRRNSATGQPSAGRVGTVEELASPRKLPVELLRDTFGIRGAKDGWTYPIDDEDASGFTRIKRGPWLGKPKYKWTPKGCPASDLVYNLSRIDLATTDIYAAPGEPDLWTLHHAGLPAVSFLAGEGTAPSAKAIAKLKERLPNLRSVHLPYDLDDAGKRGAHRVAAMLLAAGLDVDNVTLPNCLGDKGDVSDLWMRCAGNVEKFLQEFYACDTERLHVQRPRVEQRDDDAYTVHLPADGGWVRFDFDRVARSARSLDAELSVSVELEGVSGEPYAASLNLFSLSSRDTLRRQLDLMYPKLQWVALVNQSVSQLRSAFFGTDQSIDLSTLTPRAQDKRYRLQTLVPEGQHSVFFGDGSSAKTYLALAIALSVRTGQPLLGLEVVPGPILFIDYETDAENLRFRLDRLLAGFGLSWQPDLLSYWPAKGRPLPDIVDAVRRKTRHDGTGLVFIDSAAAACGGEPEKAEMALAYFNSLARLETATVTIAHVVKSDKADDRKPFGSVFWHNMARATWNVKRVQEEGQDEIHIALYNRKANDARLALPLGFSIAFDGETGPVTMKRVQIADVPELDKTRTLKPRILDFLKRGPSTVDRVAKDLKEDPDTVRARLNDLKGGGKVRHVPPPEGQSGTYWGLCEDRYS